MPQSAPRDARLPRGIPAASLKRPHRWPARAPRRRSSAGNTRGLIEAASYLPCIRNAQSLPRGIPAASLKLWAREPRPVCVLRLPRGIPAASLKLVVGTGFLLRVPGLPRGIPAASLKPAHGGDGSLTSVCLPRGIPAASLKQASASTSRSQSGRLPRGIPAASLKRLAIPCKPTPGGEGLPRGIPAASLKLYGTLVACPHFASIRSRGKPPRGYTRGSHEATFRERKGINGRGLPRGIPAASLKRSAALPEHRMLLGASSRGFEYPAVIEPGEAGTASHAGANNVSRGESQRHSSSSPGRVARGLPASVRGGIPAASIESPSRCATRMTPSTSSAASLKPAHGGDGSLTSVCLPRGIPAASLKQASASTSRSQSGRLPRGIPAASLKRLAIPCKPTPGGEGLPRGIPAASLKLYGTPLLRMDITRVFRGEYPRPH